MRLPFSGGLSEKDIWEDLLSNVLLLFILFFFLIGEDGLAYTRESRLSWLAVVCREPVDKLFFN